MGGKNGVADCGYCIRLADVQEYCPERAEFFAAKKKENDAEDQDASWKANGVRIIRCTNPGCDKQWCHLEADHPPEGEEQCQACNHAFCRGCKEPWVKHGVSHGDYKDCGEYKKTIDDPAKIAAETATAAWKAANSKVCPGCKIDFQKNGGCDHITCKCGYEWCYICLREWAAAGGYGHW